MSSYPPGASNGSAPVPQPVSQPVNSTASLNTPNSNGSIIPDLPQLLNNKTESALKEFHLQCFSQYNQNWAIRDQMAYIDRQYQRELDYSLEQSRARAANRYGDKSRFQNITIPIVLPQVEGSVTYQASVFLTGTPLFGVISDPQYEDEAQQMEAIIDSQATYGGWIRELTMFFRDGAKYNLSALEVDWCKEVTYAPETDPTIKSGKASGKLTQTIWEGNKVKRWDMYNTFFDTRVTPGNMYRDGEFIGNTEIMSRIKLKKFMSELPNGRASNFKAALESPTGAINVGDSTTALPNFYIPQINPNSILNPLLGEGMNWLAWSELAGSKDSSNINYRNLYEVTTLYARIIPSDFGISGPSPNTPQVWKFIFVNHSILIFSERQTNAHNWLPVLMGQPNEDGLGYQTKSLADNVSPIQDITSALSNSDIAARRRAISDRTLYDPSRVNAADINSPNPSAKIPVRPAAYGKPLEQAVYAFPFRDDQSQFIQQKIASYSAMANMISGQNPVRQGQFVKGNKTQSEFDSVMNNANGRDQLTSICYEAQVFTPLKRILLLNNLQYQGGTSLFNPNTNQQVTIDPVALRSAVLSFKVSDGLTPSDKLMDTDTTMVALQMIGTSPAIGAAYNVGPLFSYLMKEKNAHISSFEKGPAQQAYEAAQAQYQQTLVQIYKANPNVTQQQLPPAPLPQDYGYNPAQAAGNDASNTATGNNVQPASNNPAQGTQAANPVTQALQASTQGAQ